MEETPRLKMDHIRQPLSVNKYIFSAILILTFYSFIPLSGAELIYFYEKGCPRCAQIDNFLKKRIIPNYHIEIRRFEIHEAQNALLLNRLAEVFGSKEILKKGTPAIFIGNRAFRGHSRTVQRKIEQAVRWAVRNNPPSSFTYLEKTETAKGLERKISLTAVIGAAAVDSINPCAFAVLTLLLSTILISSNKSVKRVVAAGFAFSTACFISYFLMGVGLFSAFNISGIQTYIFSAVAFLSIVLGFWNVKDTFWPGRFVYQVPRPWQIRMRKIASKIHSVPGAFGSGILISFFLLPCTSGPYIVIIGMLGSTATRISALLLLVLYNLIFILPFIIITLAVAFGITTTEKIEKWRHINMPKFNLITGIFLIILGISMIVLLITGVI